MSGKSSLNEALVLTLCVTLSLIVRFAVLLTKPSFVVAGDSGEYAALVRELVSNNFAVPSKNWIYYPGSSWIYPPLLLEIFALLTKIFGERGLTILHIMSVFSVTVDSLCVIPFYYTIKRLFGKASAVFGAFLFVGYYPDIYALTWGAHPQIFATFLLLCSFYFLVRAVESQSLRFFAFSGLTLSLISLSHDLTTFVALSGLGVYFVTRCIKAIRTKIVDKTLVGVVISLAIFLPSFGYWYLPRLSWVLGVAFSAQSAGFTPNFSSFVGSVVQPLGPVFPFLLLLLLLFSFLSAKKLSRMEKGEGVWLLISFVIGAFILMLFELKDVVLATRLSYYIFLPAALLVCFVNRKRSTLFALFLASLLVLNVAVAVQANSRAHTYFDECFECDSRALVTQMRVLTWIAQNVPRSAVFASAGELGYYIAGLDGNPTLVYHPLEYLTQPQEKAESLAAYVLVYQSAQNLSLTMKYVFLYNVSYVVVYNPVVQTPCFYEAVYKDSTVTVFRVVHDPSCVFSQQTM
ncbi:hypothetical protein B9Q00_09260 [Candidatus Marsarchaeota G1 archaeon OSP_C]|jgi:hypothetical protein|uniref:Glycosyltransferase RgtA/B/C/D-like domain-containing protein n=1 Tax=Candidatus Marsarchaeota G1 archaeon OSP_C TaxID=1978154 RepID=A0A2R6ALM7_9ARCH|nr:MAG: hypothetical protein B9Q00_09260 [Candidatus Marsarchaeota G1 archaeon OSP_C]